MKVLTDSKPQYTKSRTLRAEVRRRQSGQVDGTTNKSFASKGVGSAKRSNSAQRHLRLRRLALCAWSSLGGMTGVFASLAGAYVYVLSFERLK